MRATDGPEGPTLHIYAYGAKGYCVLRIQRAFSQPIEPGAYPFDELGDVALTSDSDCPMGDVLAWTLAGDADGGVAGSPGLTITSFNPSASGDRIAHGRAEARIEGGMFGGGTLDVDVTF